MLACCLFLQANTVLPIESAGLFWVCQRKSDPLSARMPVIEGPGVVWPKSSCLGGPCFVKEICALHCLVDVMCFFFWVRRRGGRQLALWQECL